MLIEPFVGSASVFLNTDYDHYLLNDINKDLINVYQILQREGMTFIEATKQYFTKQYNQKNKYYDLREQFNASKKDWERAVLFLYLNRHGFNGLCRYNQSGYFNVPFGLHKKPYFPLEEMIHFHKKSQIASFTALDFEACLLKTKKFSVVYCDPPYVPLSLTASFTSYSKHRFGLDNQLKLAELAEQLSQKGVAVLISNHDTAFTRKTYERATLKQIWAPRVISCKGNQRKPVKELLALF